MHNDVFNCKQFNNILTILYWLYIGSSSEIILNSIIINNFFSQYYYSRNTIYIACFCALRGCEIYINQMWKLILNKLLYIYTSHKFQVTTVCTNKLIVTNTFFVRWVGTTTKYLKTKRQRRITAVLSVNKV